MSEPNYDKVFDHVVHDFEGASPWVQVVLRDDAKPAGEPTQPTAERKQSGRPLLLASLAGLLIVAALAWVALAM